MRKLLFSTAFVISFGFVSAASAACFGSGAFQNCNDDSGNSYTVQRFGNTTITQGHNSRTGSSWSQNSQRMGNFTYHSGQAANGNSWNSTEQRLGKTRYFSGTDSDGNSFSGGCNAYSCW